MLVIQLGHGDLKQSLGARKLLLQIALLLVGQLCRRGRLQVLEVEEPLRNLHCLHIGHLCSSRRRRKRRKRRKRRRWGQAVWQMEVRLCVTQQRRVRRVRRIRRGGMRRIVAVGLDRLHPWFACCSRCRRHWRLVHCICHSGETRSCFLPNFLVQEPVALLLCTLAFELVRVAQLRIGLRLALRQARLAGWAEDGKPARRLSWLHAAAALPQAHRAGRLPGANGFSLGRCWGGIAPDLG